MAHITDNDELDVGHARVPILTIYTLGGLECVITLTEELAMEHARRADASARARWSCPTWRLLLAVRYAAVSFR